MCTDQIISLNVDVVLHCIVHVLILYYSQFSKWIQTLFDSLFQACLPLIDDLSNPAMRTRHWKKLVQVTKGGINIDTDSLKRMTLGELLGLGLQSKWFSIILVSIKKASNFFQFSVQQILDWMAIIHEDMYFLGTVLLYIYVGTLSSNII